MIPHFDHLLVLYIIIATLRTIYNDGSQAI